ncbi:DUF1003 domain-containing protein [Phenylobacterium sp.]|uniref:DUF1003 domain-containing protein n=1 Tax=Phenylobacterium sp. TaxID=1871053 RepID=UPI0035B34148
MANQQRQQLAQELLNCSYEELTDIQRSVIDLIATEAPTGVDRRLIIDDRTPGERLADRVAAIGGSWGFILGFALALALWMGWNVLGKGGGLAFDPYPFIFLNLVLSTLAAVQAPIIMMSQNRAAARDREAAEHDYVVNLRAELEIMHLHDKLDRIRQRELLQMIRRQNEALRILRAELSEAFKPGPPDAAPAAAGRKRAGKRAASARGR